MLDGYSRADHELLQVIRGASKFAPLKSMTVQVNKSATLSLHLVTNKAKLTGDNV